MNKAEQREAIRERARAALRELYHNATPAWSRDMYGRTDAEFQSWFEGAAESEIDYLRSGGAYGNNYRKTLAADCNAGRYKSERARTYYIEKGMRARDMERADCGALTGRRVLERAVVLARGGAIRYTSKTPTTRHDAQWERINEYGKLYQWGRGGRTLAPDGLISQRGGSSFSIKEDYADNLPMNAVIDLIRVVESFNRYVGAWCASVPEQWRDYCADLAREERAERKRAKEAAKEEARRAEIARCFC